MMEFNIFDILYVKTNVNTSAKSHVQQIERPVVIIQNDSGNKFAPTLIVMCLTSKIKKVEQPTHEVIKAITTGFPITYNRNFLMSTLKTQDKNKEKTILFAEKGHMKI